MLRSYVRARISSLWWKRLPGLRDRGARREAAVGWRNGRHGLSESRSGVDSAARADRLCGSARIDRPGSRVREELAAASAFALVSLEENSPMGIEEAMGAGVPVVTSNRCGMPYMVSHGRTGYLVDPNDPDQIADRLGDLLADDALRVRMGETARTVALARFHPRVVAERTREVYATALRR